MEKISTEHYSNYSSSSKGKNYLKVDEAVEQCRDIIDPQYLKWHYRKCNEVGCSRYLETAVQAREGLYPQRLLVHLLKN